MARRRYMHGKRRRKSSCAPFKKHKPGHVEPKGTNEVRESLASSPQVLSDDQVTGFADYLGGLEGGVKKPEASESNTLLDAVRGVSIEDINPPKLEELNALGEISPVGSQAEIFGGVISDEEMGAVTSAFTPAQRRAYDRFTEGNDNDWYHSMSQKFGDSPNYKGDHIAENILEFFDPTGLSSWDDAARAWKYGSAWDKFIETVGVIPLVGKFKAPIKAVAGGINLIKKTDPKTIGKVIKGITKKDVVEGVGFVDVAQDVYEDNIKPLFTSNNDRNPDLQGSLDSGWRSHSATHGGVTIGQAHNIKTGDKERVIKTENYGGTTNMPNVLTALSKWGKNPNEDPVVKIYNKKTK